MTKEDFVEEVSKLPGVGKKKAEALYDAGFTTVEKVKAATLEELQQAEGIGEKVAEAIQAGLADIESDDAGKIEVREGKAAPGKPKAEKAEVKAEVVEPEAVYRVKIKPQISEELKAALEVREHRRSRQPAFRRYHWWYRKGMDPDVWRAPKGTLSKQRRGFKYRPPRVKVGYGKPSITRGLHPSGFEEVLVHNPAELVLVDPKTQAARIGGTVGGRKRLLIESAAAEQGIRILNPRRT